MRGFWPLLGLLLALSAVGCAARQEPVQERVLDPEDRLAAALVLAERAGIDAARAELAAIYGTYAAATVGQKALLVLVAAELDPRNPERSPQAAAELTAAHLARRAAQDWARPVSEVLYLLALEVGDVDTAAVRTAADSAAALAARLVAAERAAADRAATDVAGSAAAAFAPWELPDLPGPAFPAQVEVLEAERERLQAQVARLEEEVAKRDRELERIRRTLRP